MSKEERIEEFELQKWEIVLEEKEFWEKFYEVTGMTQDNASHYDSVWTNESGGNLFYILKGSLTHSMRSNQWSTTDISRFKYLR
jgi:hypothetical protein